MAIATSTEAGTIRLAGDLAGSDDGLNPELTATGVVAGQYRYEEGYGDSVMVPSIAVDGKGRITAATTIEQTFNRTNRATIGEYGVVKVDGLTVRATTQGVISAEAQVATTSRLGVVKPDGVTIFSSDSNGRWEGLIGIKPTDYNPGIVQPDGSTITVTSGGVISATVVNATSATFGAVRPDGTTISFDASQDDAIKARTATSTLAGMVMADDVSIVTRDKGVISLTAVGLNLSNTFSSATVFNGQQRTGYGDRVGIDITSDAELDGSGGVLPQSANIHVLEAIGGDYTINGFIGSGMGYGADLTFILRKDITARTFTFNNTATLAGAGEVPHFGGFGGLFSNIPPFTDAQSCIIRGIVVNKDNQPYCIGYKLVLVQNIY